MKPLGARCFKWSGEPPKGRVRIENTDEVDVDGNEMFKVVLPKGIEQGPCELWFDEAWPDFAIKEQYWGRQFDKRLPREVPHNYYTFLSAGTHMCWYIGGDTEEQHRRNIQARFNRLLNEARKYAKERKHG